jgi:hypothetical protein
MNRKSHNFHFKGYKMSCLVSLGEKSSVVKKRGKQNIGNRVSTSVKIRETPERNYFVVLEGSIDNQENWYARLDSVHINSHSSWLLYEDPVDIENQEGALEEWKEFEQKYVSSFVLVYFTDKPLQTRILNDQVSLKVPSIEAEAFLRLFFSSKGKNL